jgi:hypothetical protein
MLATPDSMLTGAAIKDYFSAIVRMREMIHESEERVVFSRETFEREFDLIWCKEPSNDDAPPPPPSCCGTCCRILLSDSSTASSAGYRICSDHQGLSCTSGEHEFHIAGDFIYAARASLY